MGTFKRIEEAAGEITMLGAMSWIYEYTVSFNISNNKEIQLHDTEQAEHFQNIGIYQPTCEYYSCRNHVNLVTKWVLGRVPVFP